MSFPACLELLNRVRVGITGRSGLGVVVVVLTG